MPLECKHALGMQACTKHASMYYACKHGKHVDNVTMQTSMMRPRPKHLDNVVTQQRLVHAHMGRSASAFFPAAFGSSALMGVLGRRKRRTTGVSTCPILAVLGDFGGYRRVCLRLSLVINVEINPCLLDQHVETKLWTCTARTVALRAGYRLHM
jgi:hypothetical protein